MRLCLKVMALLVLVVWVLGLSACHHAPSRLAHIEIRHTPKHTSYYRVKKGDTLASIARRHRLGINDLITKNHLKKPYLIHPGQTLTLEKAHHSFSVAHYKQRLHKAGQHVAARFKPSRVKKTRVKKAAQYKASPVKRANTKKVLPPAHVVVTTQPTRMSMGKLRWFWPAKGQLLTPYSQVLGKRNNGIDIAGRLGMPVRAAADGRVVYSGSGLRGYGNLVIVKHGEEFLSAYAHNSKLLVKEGQWVRAQQTIAEMGKRDKLHVALHFEIRRGGKPVDPRHYLPKA